METVRSACRAAALSLLLLSGCAQPPGLPEGPATAASGPPAGAAVPSIRRAGDGFLVQGDRQLRAWVGADGARVDLSDGGSARIGMVAAGAAHVSSDDALPPPPGAFLSAKQRQRVLIEREGSRTDEWWSPAPLGLEHGFTTWDGGEIQIAAEGGRFEVEGPSSARLRLAGGGWLAYTGLRAWDADDRAVPATFSERDGDVAIILDTAGARFPVEVDPILTPSWTVGPPVLGSGVRDVGMGDVDGDGYDDVLVLAGPSSGAIVYLFSGSIDGPSLVASDQATIAGSYGAAGSLVVSDVTGDGFADVVVGLSGFSSGQSAEGGVFFLAGGASGLPAAGTLVAQSNQASAFMGTDLSAGDLDGDGFADVAVTAPGWDGGSTDEGAVFLFPGTGVGLGATSIWSFEPNQGNAGASLTVAFGDFQGDGFEDLAVGVPSFDLGGGNAGRVWAWNGSASGLLATAWSSVGTAGDQCGAGLAAAGDLDGDGKDDVVVGCPNAGPGGELRVYLGTSAGPAAAALVSSGPIDEGWGTALAYAGDTDGDGFDDLAGANPAWGDDEGWVRVWEGGSAALGPVAWDGVAEGRAGLSIASAGNLDGDGFADLVFSNMAPNSTSLPAAVSGFFGGPSGLAGPYREGVSWIPGDTAGSWMGTTVQPAGDLDGDGFDEVAATGWSFSDGVWVFAGSATGPESPATWWFEGMTTNTAPIDMNGDGYDDLVIGDPYWAVGYPTYQEGGRMCVRPGSSAGPFPGSVPWTYGDLVPYQSSGRAFFAHELVPVGDVNGDSKGDLVVTQPANSSSLLKVRLYLGSTNPPGSAYRTWTYSNSTWGTDTLFPVAPGDIDGNGYDDILVGVPRLYDASSTPVGGAFLYLGSSGGPATAPAWSFLGSQAGAEFGRTSANVGDVTGDSRPDLLVLAPRYDWDWTSQGMAYLFAGTATGLSAAPQWTQVGVSGSMDTELARLGDVQGDGAIDVAGRVTGQLWDVGPSGFVLGQSYPPAPEGDLDGPFPLGDYTGDGYDDVAVSDHSWADQRGEVAIVPGAPVDDDSDGFYLGADCDDADPAVHPGAPELCDGLDNDCDGLADEEFPGWYADDDGDSFGDPLASVTSCVQPAGYVGDATDCDDGDSGVHPGAAETCDGEDEDCDGTADEVPVSGGLPFFPDVDGDGAGAPGAPVYACTAPAGTSATQDDCDPADPSVFPGAPESCDGDDEDCDGPIDEGPPADAPPWYADVDGDGYGDPATAVAACSAPAGLVSDGSDCDDTDASVSPGAAETCGGGDENCDGLVDEDSAIDAPTWYEDGDGDGWGDPGAPAPGCTPPLGYVAAAGDCSPGSSAVHPGADETCNLVDEDCDGIADEPPAVGAPTWYVDTDGDGFGSTLSTLSACQQPGGYAPLPTDCDDGSSSVSPSAPEQCNTLDDDCDGAIDEGSPSTAPLWYRDGDGDGTGDSLAVLHACAQPAGYVGVSGDCDDADPARGPGTSEWCDGVDNDCDGSVDEGLDEDGDGLPDCEDTEVCDGLDNDGDGAIDEADAVGAPLWYLDSDGDGLGDPTGPVAACSAPDDRVDDGTDCDDSDPGTGGPATWYADTDGDGFGNGAADVASCSAPDGCVADPTDCNDGDPATHPGAAEIWYDGVDQGCDGGSDWDADGDGQDVASHGGGDCDDGDPDVYTGAPDDPYDGRVTDCASPGDYDADQDGHLDQAHGGDDCDDSDPTVGACPGGGAGGDQADCACRAGPPGASSWTAVALLALISLRRRERGPRSPR